MTDVAQLRDSTQILLPCETLEAIPAQLDERFRVTVRCEEGGVRIIGSPVEIKDVSEFLARNGVTVA